MRSGLSSRNQCEWWINRKQCHPNEYLEKLKTYYWPLRVYVLIKMCLRSQRRLSVRSVVFLFLLSEKTSFSGVHTASLRSPQKTLYLVHSISLTQSLLCSRACKDSLLSMTLNAGQRERERELSLNDKKTRRRNEIRAANRKWGHSQKR